jgi:hypothetical protein
LLIYPDAVLTFAIPLQGFEPVGGRYQQVPQLTCRVQVLQLFTCPLLKSSIHALQEQPPEELLGSASLE